jgi:hypothetical protein
MPADTPLTDRDRLNWMIKREAYVSENRSVPRWIVYSSQACLEEIGRAQRSPRAAIDNAIERERSNAH